MNRLFVLVLAWFLALAPGVDAQVHTNASTAAGTGLGQRIPAPVILAKSNIPFIGLSSGSVSAAGAISGITALPIAYPNAYCFFPASILATSGTGSTAGWYFCQFSSTSAGTACLNPYTSGIPSIPTCTPVTAGQGAFTGDVTEEMAQTLTVPGNLMGKNGQLRLTFVGQQNSTAGIKVYRARYSSSTGTILFAINGANTAKAMGASAIIGNAGVTNVQTAAVYATGNVTDSNSAPAGIAADTTVATTAVFSEQRAAATDNMIIQSVLIELLADGT